GLSQQDLAFKAKEKVTVIQKIEIGKMLPTMRLAKELEHILRIRLLVPRDELDIPAPPRRPSPSPGVTLGDVAVVRHKEGSDECVDYSTHCGRTDLFGLCKIRERLFATKDDDG